VRDDPTQAKVPAAEWAWTLRVVRPVHFTLCCPELLIAFFMIISFFEPSAFVAPTSHVILIRQAY
jgi:hypothetical protein